MRPRGSIHLRDNLEACFILLVLPICCIAISSYEEIGTGLCGPIRDVKHICHYNSIRFEPDEYTDQPRLAPVITENDLVTAIDDSDVEDVVKEDEFHAAIHDGDIATFMEILNSKEEYDLDLEYKDSNGRTALQAAIHEGFSVMVSQLLKHDIFVGDALLRAVDVGFLETVKEILSYASNLPNSIERRKVLECHCVDDDFHADVTPIVLAAQRNDFAVVKLLLDLDCKITDVSSKEFSTSATDSLQKSVGAIEIYTALASEAYIAWSTVDPVDNAFVLSDKLQKLSKTDVEFKSSYLELAESLNMTGTDIISYARDTEEILTVLSYHNHETVDATNAQLDPLPKLTRAIAFDQKEFVAHPNCQQTVKSKFYGRMSYLLDRTAAYRLVFFLLVGSTFPALSLLYVCVPKPWIKPIVECPYIKFILHMASDVFFVLIITIDTLLYGGNLTAVSLFKPTRSLLLVWVIGIGWHEVQIWFQRGWSFMTKETKHIRDSAMVALFTLAIILDSIEYFTAKEQEDLLQASKRDVIPGSTPVVLNHHQTLLQQLNQSSTNNANDHLVLHRVPTLPVNRILNPGVASGRGEDDSTTREYRKIKDQVFRQFNNYDWWHLHLLSTGLLALATVLALLRMLPYVVVSDVIGPLQISLGTMVCNTVHFFVFIGVVFLAFAVGLTYIYSYYDEVNLQICVKVNGEDNCQSGKFANLFFGAIYLYWSVFGLESIDALHLGRQSILLEITGYLLYAMFYILLVVVLLNALVAVMSSVYNQIEENADVEWKFATASMWVRYMGEGDVVPPPFNILPSTKCLINLYKETRRRWQRRKASSVKRERDLEDEETNKFQRSLLLNKQKRDDIQYQRVIAHLVERYVAAKTADEVSVEAEITIADIRALRNDLLALKLEMFQRLNETTSNIDHTIGKTLVVKEKSENANRVFRQTEEIYSVVDVHMDTASHFKTEVDEKIVVGEVEEVRLVEEKIASLHEKWSQTEFYKFQRRKSTQCDELPTNEDATQTLMFNNDEISQTDGVNVNDESAQTDSAKRHTRWTQTRGAVVGAVVAVSSSAASALPKPTTRYFKPDATTALDKETAAGPSADVAAAAAPKTKPKSLKKAVTSTFDKKPKKPTLPSGWRF